MQLHSRDSLDTQSSCSAAAQELDCVEPDAASGPIEKYIEELRVGLRRVDAAASAETCEEIRLHLCASALARIELGVTSEEAEKEALLRFGVGKAQVYEIADQLRRKALRTDRRAAFRFALKTYGAAAAIDVVCATIFCCLTDTTRFHFALDYWQWYCIFWLLSGSALVTGWRVGSQTVSRAVRATFLAHLLVIALLLLASGIVAAVIGVGAFSFNDSSRSPCQLFVDMTFGIACYHVTRTPLSLIAAWTAGRLERKNRPLARG